MSETAAADRRIPGLLLGIAVLWALLWVVGFPPPCWDDLFFAGVGIEIFQTGHIANPWLRQWNPITAERYFIQPPFYFHALAGWLEVFDLGSWSLRAFQCLMGAIASIFAVLLLRRYRFSGAAAAPVFILLLLGVQGLRPNAMGLALFTAGLWLLSGKSARRQLAGLLLLGASVGTWITLVVYALPFGAAVAGADWLRRDPPSRGYLAKRLALTAAATLALLGLFLAAIGFRLSEFVADFTWHTRLRQVTRLLDELRFQVTNGHGEIFYAPLYALLLALMLACAVRWRDLRAEAKLFLAALTAGLAANLLLYARSMHYLFDLFCWIGVTVLAGELPFPRPVRRAATACVLAVFAITQTYPALRLLGTKREPESSYQAVREQVRGARRVAFDEVAARYVFDYRLPEGAVYWNFSAPPPGNCPNSADERDPGVTWVLSPTKSGVTRGLPPYERVRLFGREFRSMPARPFQVVVIGGD